MREIGELYFPSEENKEIRKDQIFNGKRYRYQKIFLDQDQAKGAAAAHRQRDRLARVVPKKVWTHKYGYEYGYDKVDGWVLYVHWF